MKEQEFNLELSKLYEQYTALLAIEASNKSLPFKFSWKIDDIKEVFKKHGERYENERKLILEAVGTPNEENPALYNVKTEKMDEYTKKMEDLGKIKVDVKFKPISLSEFEAVKDLQVPGGVLSSLRGCVLQLGEDVAEKASENGAASRELKPVVD